MWGSQFVTILCHACFIVLIIIHPPSWLISSGIIQDSEDDPSCTPMASSSKQNTSELGVKESEEESNASSLNAKTEALHAFHTITTMFSLIQSKGSTAGNWPKLGCQEKILLQLLDAFTAILVRINGVIAVTAWPYDGSGKVEVLASYLGNGDSLTISQPWSPGCYDSFTYFSPLIFLVYSLHAPTSCLLFLIYIHIFFYRLSFPSCTALLFMHSLMHSPAQFCTVCLLMHSLLRHSLVTQYIRTG